MKVNINTGLKMAWTEIAGLQHQFGDDFNKMISAFVTTPGLVVQQTPSGISADFGMSQAGNNVTLTEGYAIIETQEGIAPAFMPTNTIDITTPSAGYIVVRPIRIIALEGTVTVTNGTVVVTGDASTEMLKRVGPGTSLIIVDSALGNNGIYPIASASDNQTLNLQANFPGTTESGLSFVIGGNYATGWQPASNDDFSLWYDYQLDALAVSSPAAGDIVVATYTATKVLNDLRLQNMAVWQPGSVVADAVTDGQTNGITTKTQRASTARIEPLLSSFLVPGVIYGPSLTQMLVSDTTTLSTNRTVTVSPGSFVDAYGRAFTLAAATTIPPAVAPGTYYLYTYGDPASNAINFSFQGSLSSNPAYVLLAQVQVTVIAGNVIHTLQDMRVASRLTALGITLLPSYPSTQENLDGTVSGDWMVGEIRISQDGKKLAFLDSSRMLRTLATETSAGIINLPAASGLEFADGSQGQNPAGTMPSIQIKVNPNRGIVVDDNGIAVLPGAGMKVDANGIGLADIPQAQLGGVPVLNYEVHMSKLYGGSWGLKYAYLNGVVAGVKVSVSMIGSNQVVLGFPDFNATTQVAFVSMTLDAFAGANMGPYSGSDANSMTFFLDGFDVWINVRVYTK